MLTKVKELRRSDGIRGRSSLFLNAGDYYTGTVMFDRFGYQVVLDMSNMMGYDAMALGNHDFDRQMSGLEPYINSANYDILGGLVSVVWTFYGSSRGSRTCGSAFM